MRRSDGDDFGDMSVSAEHETRGLAVVRMRAGEAPPGWVKRGGQTQIRKAREAVEGWQPHRYSKGSYSEYLGAQEET